MIPDLIFVQIVGAAVPCPGLRLQIAVSWHHRCRPHPPTRWDDSFCPRRLSHRVSRRMRARLLQLVLLFECYYIGWKCIFIHSTQRGTQNEAGEETSQSGVIYSYGADLFHSVLNLQYQSSPNYLHNVCLLDWRQQTIKIATFSAGVFWICSFSIVGLGNETGLW